MNNTFTEIISYGVIVVLFVSTMALLIAIYVMTRNDRTEWENRLRKRKIEREKAQEDFVKGLNG